MTLFTSSQFASTAASGTDWRDTVKIVLEQLESIRTSGDQFNFGFIYISEHLAQDASSILNLFRSVLDIENWVGCVGVGVCACGQEYIDEPAISAMIGRFDDADFCVFPPVAEDIGALSNTLGQWLNDTEPMMMLVHGTPTMHDDPSIALRSLEQATNGFICGGFSSAQGNHSHIANQVYDEDISGVAFSKDIKVATTLSQGCIPLGDPHIITRSEGNIIRELDGERAIHIFEEELRNVSAKSNQKGTVNTLHDLLEGDVHIAFSDIQSDQSDYIIRDIINLEQTDGSFSVARNVTIGETIRFVYRNAETIKQDLCSRLISLRERVQKETGNFEPKGAIYISCVARAFDQNGQKKNGEIELVQEIIGDVPLTGFYASGEVSNARLYGYTGILILFL